MTFGLLQPPTGDYASMRSPLTRRGEKFGAFRVSGEVQVRMRACRTAANAVPRAYNPDGGERVQLAWQRFSISRWWAPCAALRCVRSDGPAHPAVCR